MDHLHHILSMHAAGASQRRIASTLCLPLSTVHRAITAHLATLATASTPFATSCAPITNPAERKISKTAWLFTATDLVHLRTARLRSNSIPLAVRHCLAQNSLSPLIHAKLTDLIARAHAARKIPSFPLSVRQACFLSLENRALFRGGKNLDKYTLLRSRGAFFTDAHGIDHPLYPHAVWESDDMSINQPFRYDHPDTGLQTTGRQTLITCDVFSHAILSCSPIGREQDSYRAEDIMDHLLHSVLAHGLPSLWRIERGRWRNHAIMGIKTKSGKIWGALSDIIQIAYAYTTGGKGTIENTFNHLQNLLAHSSLDIGRSRGEFANAARTMRQAHTGNERALSQLWTIDECAAALAANAAIFNSLHKSCAMHDATIIPAELLSTAVFRPLADKDRWYFMPIKRELSVRSGTIKCKVPHYPKPFIFQINGVTPQHFNHGTPVLVAFHPAHPDQGAFIFNGMKLDDPRNQDSWAWGAPLLLAPHLPAVAQWSDDTSAHDAKAKNASAAMRGEFHAINPHKQGTLKHVSEKRDSLGNNQSFCSAPKASPTPSKRKLIISKAPSIDDARQAFNIG